MADDHIGPESIDDLSKAPGMRDVPTNDAKFHNARDLYYNVNDSIGLWQSVMVHRELVEFLLEIRKSSNWHDCTEVP